MTDHESHSLDHPGIPAIPHEVIDAFIARNTLPNESFTRIFSENQELFHALTHYVEHTSLSVRKNAGNIQAFRNGALWMYSLLSFVGETRQLKAYYDAGTTDAVDGVAPQPSVEPNDDPPTDVLFRAPPDQ